MDGEGIINAIADVIEKTVADPQYGSKEWINLLIENLRARAERAGYEDWEERMGDEL